MESHNNIFINKILPFKNGLFVSKPNIEKGNLIFLLVDGKNEDLLVNERTSIKQIRDGKYTKLIEIINYPITKEIKITAPAKENSYNFLITLNLTLEHTSPFLVLQNKTLIIEDFLHNQLSLEVRRITKMYSVLDFGMLGDQLTEKLMYPTQLEPDVGVKYRVSSVTANLSEEALKFLRKQDDIELGAEIRKKESSIGSSLITNFRTAIGAQIARGEISEEEAVYKIEEYESNHFHKDLDKYMKLVKGNIYTEAEVRDHIRGQLSIGESPSNNIESHKLSRDHAIKSLLKEDEGQ
ncbi:MAG: hypothetical protein BGO41_09810 [Clostridiales bacterium 38-18]|mgnify:CR=1 FL=1|nr:MAG: hypothetical protein BGO41_09810 [Clostridiales bacterium 38-18]